MKIKLNLNNLVKVFWNFFNRWIHDCIDKRPRILNIISNSIDRWFSLKFKLIRLVFDISLFQ